MYLKQWAAALDVPIVSIDYSLAPQAPFPRALEEIFYAYCWALKSPENLGWTGENIVFVGDSAGGALNTACVIKCIQMGVPVPKGLLNIYTMLDVSFGVTPSRFLTLIDPLLTYGQSVQVFKAYNVDHKRLATSCASIDVRKQLPLKRSYESYAQDFNYQFQLQDDPLMSPFVASDEILSKFPPTNLVDTSLDPFLDENIEFGKRLRNLNVDVRIDVFNGLVHGFLNFIKVS